MKFQIDHDLHIHSLLSLCSLDKEQTAENILLWGEKNSLKKMCLTDHLWDGKKPGNCDFYDIQDFEYVSQGRPLPKSDTVDFRFGCEVEMDKNFTIGINPDHFDDFSFIIVPTTHLHFDGFTIDAAKDGSIPKRAALWRDRIKALNQANLPFHKVGLAHMTCHLMAPGDKQNTIDVLNLISDEEMTDLMTDAARLGYGIELNANLKIYDEEELKFILRPFLIAKECGCKFYVGSDSHHPDDFPGALENQKLFIDLLDLKEEDKFLPF